MAQAALIGLNAAMTISQGISQSETLHGEARALDENGRRIDTQGAYDAVSALRQSRLQEGVDITSGAASGSGLSSLSDLLAQNAVERQLEAMNIRYAAGQRGDALRTEAAQKRADGRAALFGSIFRAGAGAIQGIAQSNANKASAGAATRVFNERIGRSSSLPAGKAQGLGTIPIPTGWGGY
jgi:hypothetical protein